MSTKDVANFIVDMHFDKLPRSVVKQAKIAIQDTLGVALAAYKDRAVVAARRVAVGMNGREESTLIGIGKKVPCNIAAWVNAVMASTLDMDDGAWGTTGHKGHLGGVVIPCSLAIAERQNAKGKDLIEAVAIGYEVGLRTGHMMAKTVNYPVVSGTPGTYAAAAAAAKLLKLDQKKIVDALGISEAHSPWYRGEAFYPVSMTKEAMGWGAITGVSAALLAMEGFGGRRTIFDLPNYDRKPLQTLGKEWEILTLYFKPYSACRFCHSSIDGVMLLFRKHNISLDDISKIIVGVPSIRIAENFANYRPATIWQAQYSIPFTVGAALADGEVGPEQIAENRLRDKLILGLADRVKLVVDPEVEGLGQAVLASRINIETKEGNSFEIFISFPRGGPENPLGEDELAGKFRKLTTMAMGPDKTEDLIKSLDRLEDIGNINELMKIISYSDDNLP
jgi:2-methylcitrate dehydratase PrpD